MRSSSMLNGGSVDISFRDAGSCSIQQSNLLATSSDFIALIGVLWNVTDPCDTLYMQQYGGLK